MANSNTTTRKKATTRKSRKGIPSPNKGKTLTNFKDVQIRFMAEGADGVRTMNGEVDGGLSRSVLWNAINQMPGNQNIDDLRSLAIELRGEPNTGGGRGRSAPTVGSNRSYKAQQIKEGGCFLRLPLDTLGVEKAQVVGVHFEDGRIVVDLNTEGLVPAAPEGTNEA